MSEFPIKKIGRIQISERLFLQFLDLNDGGMIKGIRQDPMGFIEVGIEHPDMPTVIEGGNIPIVTPVYITTQDALGHQVTIRQKGQIT